MSMSDTNIRQGIRIFERSEGDKFNLLCSLRKFFGKNLSCLDQCVVSFYRIIDACRSENYPFVSYWLWHFVH